ncbi:hypothetical protein MLD38_010139 [Melastoma candidum]|uniref:Uncharacterized protein n=2 Tax=Melastoma candidum TaxID=119954 RepID=A0ACB9R1Y5_9MYRT|nr:hypothetical protein MLD38_010129 [Melastoma candidum]KAI4371837.1 hypothetical protein MLD38_010139 [Melastoma candidum]
MATSANLLLFSILLSIATFVCATNVTRDGRAIIIDGKRRVLLSGSIHYTRSTAQMWPDLIRKAKEGGIDAIETYVFWNAHEPVRRQYNFNGDLDLVRFVKTIQDEGLYAVLRIGPYVCAEWNYGGFPLWLHNLPNVELRTSNQVYMDEMKNFTTLIVDMMKNENLFASQGGPIIIAQIENEYGNVMSPYGDAGKSYIEWCSNMAVSQDIGVPWIMCQQSDAPQPMINTCNGWYCDQFTPNNPNSPKIWTENWTGWFKNWGGKDPLRTAQDVAFSVARFFQFGGTFQNYYMYHGGTNFGRTAGGPYITTSYDYDAPITEHGNLNQPKYGHLKQLHDQLHNLESILTSGNITNTDLGNSVTATVYATPDQSACFLSNANVSNDATVSFQGNNYDVPAWSVSILPDCVTESYNTAKVTTPTTIIVKKKNMAEDEPSSLNWTWRAESVEDTVLQGKGSVASHQLVDQKAAASDLSDYLWYMTSVDLAPNDRVLGSNMTLRVNGSGHILHAYINGELIGSEWATYGVFNYVFEKNATFKPGQNLITLLSVTVGYQNYGPFFDTIQSGVIGPVEIVGFKGDETVVKDLSSSTWSYKVGLNGMDNKLFNPENTLSLWQSEELPINRKLTWYKTTFKPPLGTDPVALDLLGLGKGEAWVNGHSIGRYWPSYLADEDGCSAEPCDYRGSYSNNKCVYNCGKPTQRYYHVPRSFMDEEVNTLVLFEEFGGNPTLANFVTVTVGSVCTSSKENTTLEMSCEGGRPISGINFASFGNPQNTCGSFAQGQCDTDARGFLVNECIGKESCAVEATVKNFGEPCGRGTGPFRLVVEYLC